jgi:hypothetical protein
MTQRVGSNRIADNAITLDKIASGVLSAATDLYARAHVNAAFEAANTIDVTAQVQPAYNHANSSYDHANAAFDAANNVQSDAIVNGTSNVRVESSGGNVQITIGGTTQTTISTNLVSHNEGVLENVMYRVNSKNITSNIVLSADYNYASIGPITIDDGVTVNVVGEWTII